MFSANKNDRPNMRIRTKRYIIGRTWGLGGINGRYKVKSVKDTGLNSNGDEVFAGKGARCGGI